MGEKLFVKTFRRGCGRLQQWSWRAVSTCLMTVIVGMPVAFAQALTVIDLQHRRADDLIPVLQPLLEKGGVMTGQDYKLFVRTSGANLAQIRSAIQQLDKQQKQLVVSVRRSTAQEMEREQASVSGSVRAGDRGVSGNATVRAGDNSYRTQGSGVSSVLVLEGNSAFIATGTTVPIVTAVAVGGGRRPFVAGTVEQRNLQRGFMVTPRVTGEQVILDISQQDERVASGNIQTQSLNTQMISRIGEWTRLGGVTESSSRTENGVLSRSYSTNDSDLSVWVKVEMQ